MRRLVRSKSEPAVDGGFEAQRARSALRYWRCKDGRWFKYVGDWWPWCTLVTGGFGGHLVTPHLLARLCLSGFPRPAALWTLVSCMVAAGAANPQQTQWTDRCGRESGAAEQKNPIQSQSVVIEADAIYAHMRHASGRPRGSLLRFGWSNEHAACEGGSRYGPARYLPCQIYGADSRLHSPHVRAVSGTAVIRPFVVGISLHG